MFGHTEEPPFIGEVYVYGRDSSGNYDKVAFGAAREKIERKYNGQKNN